VPSKLASFDASANSIARFEHYNLLALTSQNARGGQSRHASANYDHIDTPWLCG
jgi:hypothetical protein